MTLGPPPTAAGPSGDTPPAQRQDTAATSVANVQTSSAAASSASPVPGPSISTGPYTSQFSVQPPSAPRAYYARSGANPYPSQYSARQSQPSAPHTGSQAPVPSGYYAASHANYYSQQPASRGASQLQTQAGSYPYYNYPPNTWTNTWNTGSYQYGAGSSYPYPYSQSQPRASAQSSASAPQTKQAPSAPPPPPMEKKTPAPPPSPSPPPEYRKDWDALIRTFLSTIGFSQAVRGFEADMLILNPEYERKRVPAALGVLMKDLLKMAQNNSESDQGKPLERPLEERKLDYVHLANNAKPRSQTSLTKDISHFLARNRARNDASNRKEFLLSLAEKRRRLNENGDFAPLEPSPSCARTDAKTQNRDLQMKYDIAKNEDGPLRRTLKSETVDESSGASGSTTHAPSGSTNDSNDCPSAGRYPALDERLQDIEKHLAIRYVPLPPRSLLDRLKYLEDHIIHLEKEYPPWAALHFNQPNRGWPPPPRPTPIIVPSHLTSTTVPRLPQMGTSSVSSGQVTPTLSSEFIDGAAKGKGKSGRHTKSSLHRAVMERLEVQKAMNDLTGGDGG
ncbi:hypothetical protein C8Q79DRAFT_1071341 [Trametes meyenii]|nr:hypothetical protein C8Q79DRAFT_1071341 [Trametes meyenii]